MSLQCCICLNNAHDDLAIPWSTLGCGHCFHTPCITQHLAIRNICPQCRKNNAKQGLKTLYLPWDHSDEGAIDAEEALAQAANGDGDDASGKALAEEKRKLLRQIYMKENELKRLAAELQDCRDTSTTLELRVTCQERDIERIQLQYQTKCDELCKLNKQLKDQTNRARNAEMQNKQLLVDNTRLQQHQEQINRMQLVVDINLEGSELRDKLGSLIMTSSGQPLDKPAEKLGVILEERNRQVRQANKRVEDAVKISEEVKAELRRIKRMHDDETRALQEQLQSLAEQLKTQQRQQTAKNTTAAEVLNFSQLVGGAFPQQQQYQQQQSSGQQQQQQSRPPAYVGGPVFAQRHKGSRLQQQQQPIAAEIANHNNNNIINDNSRANSLIEPTELMHSDSEEEDEQVLQTNNNNGVNNSKDTTTKRKAPIRESPEDNDELYIEISSDDEEDELEIINDNNTETTNKPTSRVPLATTTTSNRPPQHQPFPSKQLTSLATAGPSVLGMATAPGRPFLRDIPRATTGDNTGTFLQHGPDGRGGIATAYKAANGGVTVNGGGFSAGFSSGIGIGGSRKGGGGGRSGGGPVKNGKKAKKADAAGTMSLKGFFAAASNQ